jgi:hypothetical protein
MGAFPLCLTSRKGASRVRANDLVKAHQRWAPLLLNTPGKVALQAQTVPMPRAMPQCVEFEQMVVPRRLQSEVGFRSLGSGAEVEPAVRSR